MVKSNNKGFSLVEIIIAAAIFAILIYPITNALITATKTGTKSTKKQYAVEKAEEIMESFKTADLSGNVNIPDGNGTKTYSFTKGTPSGKSITLPNSKMAEYSDTTYTCNDVSIGKAYETYTCQVDVNDAAYQVLKNGYVLTGLEGGATFKSDGSGAVKTNVTESGTIRNLDSKQSAIIIGATYNVTATGSNLDNLAYQYFLDAKLDVLRKYDVQYNHYLSGGGTFDEDHFQKNTKIKISKLGSTYTVECSVEYTDYTTVSVIRSQYESSGKNVYKPTTLYGDGIVYKQEFTNGLPPVYLLYVPAIYNGSYCTTDTITVDNSGISEKADVYVFETTAELSDTYKKIIREQFNVTNVDDLTYTNAGKNTKMSDVKVRLKLAAGAKTSDLNVYANFDFDNANSDYPVARLTEDQSDSVYMYDITVTLTDSEGNKTTVTGTRGK
mgnify:FL=1